MIKRAVISVSDKTGLTDFAEGLARAGVEIISTGGTLKALTDAGIAAIPISEVTKFPECLDGRVKTLHPAIAGGVLAVRTNEEHMRQLAEFGIGLIDLVVVNLYPFRETVARTDAAFEEIIENIDIGGPSMLREAAKNFAFVTAVTDTADYGRVLDAIRQNGDTDLEMRKQLAAKVFSETAFYDSMIASFLMNECHIGFPDKLTAGYEKTSSLRYGENPHQEAAWYSSPLAESGSLSKAEQLNGKELSFNNIADASAAVDILKSFSPDACCVNVKHANPCGIAVASTIKEAWEKACAADPISVYGGIIAVNRTVGKAAAESMAQIFLEIIIAPDYDDEALDILRRKKNLRVLKLDDIGSPSSGLSFKTVSGGLLVQSPDNAIYEELKTVTKRKPDEKEMKDLLFAMKCVKNTKSNAISLAKDSVLIGSGPGQTSRVGALNIALSQANEKAGGAVMASDAFFPFDDCVKAAAAAGITAIIQPGGAANDKDSIAACDEAGIAMVFTNMRHFFH